MFKFLLLSIFFSIIIYISFITNLKFKDSQALRLSCVSLGIIIGFIGSILLTNILLSISMNEYRLNAYEKYIIETKSENGIIIERILYEPIIFNKEKHLTNWDIFSWKTMHANLNHFDDNRSYYIEERKLP